VGISGDIPSFRIYKREKTHALLRLANVVSPFLYTHGTTYACCHFGGIYRYLVRNHTTPKNPNHSTLESHTMGPGLPLCCTVYSNDVSVNQIAQDKGETTTSDDMHPDSPFFVSLVWFLWVSFAGLVCWTLCRQICVTTCTHSISGKSTAYYARKRGLQQRRIWVTALQLTIYYLQKAVRICVCIHRFVAAKVSTMTTIKNETRIDDDEWQQY